MSPICVWRDAASWCASSEANVAHAFNDRPLAGAPAGQQGCILKLTVSDPHPFTSQHHSGRGVGRRGNNRPREQESATPSAADAGARACGGGANASGRWAVRTALGRGRRAWLREGGRPEAAAGPDTMGVPYEGNGYAALPFLTWVTSGAWEC